MNEGWIHVTGNTAFSRWLYFCCVFVICVCLGVCMHPSCRGGAFQAVSPVREDPAASHQAPQRCAGAQVQPQEQTFSSTLPLSKKQTCRLLCPRSAGTFLNQIQKGCCRGIINTTITIMYCNHNYCVFLHILFMGGPIRWVINSVSHHEHRAHL